MQTADHIFRLELEKRGSEYSVTAEGLYKLRIEDHDVTVSLENIRRNYERDNDAEAIVRFVEKIGLASLPGSPSWNEVRPYVRYSLEPSDYLTGMEDVVFTSINDELNQVYVFTPADGSQITWINESMLDDWGITRERIAQQAEENMAQLVADAKFEVKDFDGNLLGMIATVDAPFKASLILSPAFRDLVSPTHDWPVYVVVPCRDFAYVIRQDDREFLGRLGGVVVGEYRKSGHSITKCVLQVSDEGITKVGEYPDPE